MNLVNPKTSEEKRERFLADLKNQAVSVNPNKMIEKFREMMVEHFGPAGSVPSEVSNGD